MSEADFQPLIEWLNNNPSWILFSVFIISFVESLALAGIVVPGVLLLFLVSVVAGNVGIAIPIVLIAGFIGAVLGDGISYYIGRYFQSSIHSIWPFSRYPKLLKSGENFFHKHGGKSVVLGRFIGPIRPVIPIVAGMLGMSPGRFALFNLSSALVWAPFYIMPGYLTGKASTWIAPESFYQVLIGIALSLIIVLTLFRIASLNLQQGSALHNRLTDKSSNKLLNRLLRAIRGDNIVKSNNLSKASELPLASFVLLIFSFTFFTIWSFLATQTTLLSAFDQFINQFFYMLRAPDGNSANPIALGLSYCATFLTQLGDEAFLYISFTTFVAYLLWHRRLFSAIHIACAGLFTAFITHFLKNFWMIERPDLVVTAPSSFAYPSGHSSGATVLYGLLAAFIAQELNHKDRWKCYALFFIPMVLIAMSRLLLNVHWFSDIIGGILLGLSICGLTRLIYSRFHFREDSKRRENSTKSLVITLTIAVIATIIYQSVFFADSLDKFQLTPIK